MKNQPESGFDADFIGRKQLGEVLTQVRLRSDMTRDDVIAKSETGFSRSSLQAWESGEREPKLDNIYDLAKLYGVHPWQLISGQTESVNASTEKTISVEDAIDTLKTMIDTQHKLTEEERFLLSEFRALDDDQRRMMLRFIIGGFDSLNSGGDKKGIFGSPHAKIEDSFKG